MAITGKNAVQDHGRIETENATENKSDVSTKYLPAGHKRDFFLSRGSKTFSGQITLDVFSVSQAQIVQRLNSTKQRTNRYRLDNTIPITW